MSIKDWDSLPWHEQRIYREGLAYEVSGSLDQALTDSVTEDEVPEWAEEPAPDAEPVSAAEQERQSLGEFGITVRSA